MLDAALILDITRALRKYGLAELYFRGGVAGTREWVMSYLLPALDKFGLKVVRKVPERYTYPEEPQNRFNILILEEPEQLPTNEE